MFRRFHPIPAIPNAGLPRVDLPQFDHKIICLSEKLEAAIHYLPHSYLVYMNTAKAGCSSIKKSLWLSRSPKTLVNPHVKDESPFRYLLSGILKDVSEYTHAGVFTMVRNPYVRVLSAYLDKIATGKGGESGREFRTRFRIQGQIPSFSDFLDLVLSEQPELLDQHFAPQVYATFYPVLRYDFIGHLETPEPVVDWLSNWDIPYQEYRPHATHAAALLKEHYSAKDYDRVRAYYAVDFDAYGYSDDPEKQAPVTPVKLPDIPASNLPDLVTVFAKRRGKAKNEALARLKQNATALDQDFLHLETNSLQASEVTALVERVRRGESFPWKTLLKLAETIEAKKMSEDVEMLRRAAKEQMDYRILTEDP